MCCAFTYLSVCTALSRSETFFFLGSDDGRISWALTRHVFPYKSSRKSTQSSISRFNCFRQYFSWLQRELTFGSHGLFFLSMNRLGFSEIRWNFFFPSPFSSSFPHFSIPLTPIYPISVPASLSHAKELNAHLFLRVYHNIFFSLISRMMELEGCVQAHHSCGAVPERFWASSFKRKMEILRPDGIFTGLLSHTTVNYFFTFSLIFIKYF